MAENYVLRKVKRSGGKSWTASLQLTDLMLDSLYWLCSPFWTKISEASELVQCHQLWFSLDACLWRLP